ncbi:MAG TPA: PEGA domain-containing protein, partial [Polyangiaceae bacterium]|nr:PEGA domain-containing protein [Polyangiaceae bacterium]
MVWIDAARGRRGAAALVAGLLASALCGAASADDYETELLGGVAARDRALETRDERDWRQALLHLGRAVALQSTAEAEFEFAEAAAHLALWPEAYSGYQAALALGIDGVAAVRAREFLDAHAAGVALLDLSGPAGAAVYVGERRRGALPLARPLAVSLGALVVRVEQPGFRTWQQQLTASAGTRTQLTVSLLPVAAAQPVAPVAAF